MKVPEVVISAFGISLKHVYMRFSYLDIKSVLLSYFLICYLPGVQKQVKKKKYVDHFPFAPHKISTLIDCWGNELKQPV